ncbi:hypothetical protein BG011_000996 [Mortierella polycephala]|uniref:Uncharacterized protein n=1 Tax=Mortierella polycephala TaxID=41804 RepID=A0A9P6PKL5_9FUNG|nr:hypothetical protein BG011_000996 [Mortierella polycephala]
MAMSSAAGLSISPIADDSIYDTDHPTYAHIALLVDIGFLGMKTLESMSDDTATPSHLLELEKARSNMVTKIVHLGMKKRALLELGVMRERLIKAAMKLWDEQDLEARDRHHNQKPQIKEAIASSSSAESLKRQYQHLFMFPLPTAVSRSLASSGKSSPLSSTSSSADCIPTFMLLVLALFNNAVRCWTDVRNGALAYLLHEMTTQQDSAYEWCKNLVMIQGPSVARQFDIMFRLLFIAAGRAVERNPLREGQRHAFSLRMLGVKYFAAFQVYGAIKDKDKDQCRNSSNNIWEKIMRIGVEHDRSTRDGQSKEDIYTIATAYKNAFEFVRDMSTVDHSDASYQKWHSHFEYLVNKYPPRMSGSEDHRTADPKPNVTVATPITVFSEPHISSHYWR